MKYTVTFCQYWNYEVEAKTTEEAEDLAREYFLREMYHPVAHTFYDEVEIDPDYDEDDEDDDYDEDDCE